MAGSIQNFASPSPDTTCTCIRCSSREKKKNLYPLSLNMVGLMVRVVSAYLYTIATFIITINYARLKFASRRLGVPAMAKVLKPDALILIFN